MKTTLVVIGLTLILLPAWGCSTKLDRGVNWCKENYSGYTREDCVRQMRQNYDGT
jgi:hypothetical protein